MKKDFAEILADTIIKDQTPRLKKVMGRVVRDFRLDFAKLTIKLVDAYYDAYVPEYYIRLYEKKRGFKSKKIQPKPHEGDISLHKAIEDAMHSLNPLVSFAGAKDGTDYTYIGGIAFDESYFNANMQHSGSGIDEFDIVKNFLFSDESGRGNHPNMQRAPSASSMLDNYFQNYDIILRKHYNDALRKFK